MVGLNGAARSINELFAY